MKLFAKVLVVVAVSTVAGVSVGHALSPRGGAKASQPNPDHEADGTHSTATLDPKNYGKPGELHIKGKFIVGNPNPAGIPAAVGRVTLCVRDIWGNVLIDPFQIDEVSDEPGKGHWDQSLEWKMPLPKGQYLVELVVYDPSREVKELDGTASQVMMGGQGRRMVVR